MKVEGANDPERVRMRAAASSLALLVLTAGIQSSAQTPAAEPAYVVRGHQAEVHQRVLKERVDRFHARLEDTLRRAAPDLLPRLEPPPPIAYGYQLLPRIVADASAPPLRKPQVVSYSWSWSETLISREMATLDRLEADLATSAVSETPARDALEASITGYRTVVDHRRLIDSDFAYNWLWQRAIASDKPTFNRMTSLLNAAVEKQSRGEAPVQDADAPTGIDPPEFVRIDSQKDQERVVVVPFVTDIVDRTLVDAFQRAVETTWQVRAGGNTYRVRVPIEMITPERLYCGHGDAEHAPAGCAPPSTGNHIDLDAHVARFPPGRAVLTTGAASLRLAAGRALVLAPYDVAPRVLAHEFGHMLGFPDAYLRGYRDLGSDGFAVMEFIPDHADIMASPGIGSATERHFAAVLNGKEIGLEMRAGLDALYMRHDPAAAVDRFRSVLARNPSHYGATLQLAKALDQCGRADEAIAWWTKMMALADAARDVETARMARARLASKP